VIHDNGYKRRPGSKAHYISPLCDSWADIEPESIKMIFGIHCPVYDFFRFNNKFGWEDTGFGFFEESYNALKVGGLLIFPFYNSTIAEIDDIFKYTFENDFNSKRKWTIHFAKNSPFYIATKYEDDKQFRNHNIRDLLIFEKIA
jgi:hypothetical protein